ncbi:MAG: cytochrome c1 [Planctomycetota bacterium]|nr:MAG: cytochrome c1 [Planctomycetota bacterium]
MRKNISVFAICFFITTINPAQILAADASKRPIVPGFERFSQGKEIDQAQLGLLLLGELNCTSCHAPTATTKGLIQAKQAPLLDKVAGRIKPEYFESFIAKTHEIKPGSTMPQLSLGNTDQEKQATAKALAHYLAQQAGATEKLIFDPKQVALGKTLFAQSGCVSCHAGRDQAAKETLNVNNSVPLGALENKYTVGSLTNFLENPHQVRPSGRMPAVLKDKKEAHAVACYLLQSAKTSPKSAGVLKFEYFEGSWTKLPDFTKLKANAKGIASDFDVEVAQKANNNALRFEGWFKLQSAGKYTLHLGSDDGSKIWIDGKLIIDNDGIHPHTVISKTVELYKGEHKVEVGIFDGGGEYSLTVEIESNNLPRQPLSGICALDEKTAEGTTTVVNVAPAPAPGQPEVFKLDAALATKGRALFASVGCANCHGLNENNKRIPALIKGPELLKLRPETGCLSENPQGKSPDFALDAKQKAAIALALKNLASMPPSPDSKALINQTFLSLNCYACHQRDKIGGPEDSRNASFVSTQPEMGDEGRLPPALTGVGAKLNTDWLKQVLEQGTKVRPYMLARMPKYGGNNVNPLIKPLGEVDTIEPVEAIQFADTLSKVKTSGRLLVGSKALGCIKCHTFNNQKAEGIQALDLTSMPQRLKRDWFQRYMLDPQPFRPGTRMPAPWPMGKTFFDDILEGSTKKQIEGIYVYLSQGSKASPPEGLSRESIVLVPEKEPIIYRNFIEGAGARAIGVGYPEKVNLAFDANSLRVAMIWQGAFIDAARHWRDRGVGYQPPLGDNVISLPAGPTFATLASEKENWPAITAKEQAGTFISYTTDALGRPSFQYKYADVMITDFPTPTKNKEGGFSRAFTLESKTPPAMLYLRAAVGTKIEEQKEGWFLVDGEYKFRLVGTKKPIVRESNGKKEILVPIVFENGVCKLVQEYSW